MFGFGLACEDSYERLCGFDGYKRFVTLNGPAWKKQNGQKKTKIDSCLKQHFDVLRPVLHHFV